MKKHCPGLLCLLLNVLLVIVSKGTVIPTNAVPFVGCADTFSTSISGSSYQWNFGPNNYPQTFTGPLPAAATSFLTAGIHTIRVLITTIGGTVADSLSINVQPTTDTVLLTSNTAVCRYNTEYQLKQIKFTASPASYPAYAFFINDSLVQLSSDDSFTTALQFGDSVRVFGYNGSCFVGPSNIEYEETPPPPLLSSDLPPDNTICSGTLVTFTASPIAPGDTFLFRDGGSFQQIDTSNIWSAYILSDSSFVSVLVVNKYGCQNYFPATYIVVHVKPLPVVRLEQPGPFCTSDTVTISAIITQVPADSFYFYLNSVLQQSGTDSDFIYAGFQNNDTVTASASLNGCMSRVSNPVVVDSGDLASVSVNASSYIICQGDSDWFVAAPVLPGLHPTFRWMVNGSYVGANSMYYETNSLNNHDTVTCEMISSASCALHDTVFSQQQTITVKPVAATATITVRGDTLISSIGSVCVWKLNGNFIAITDSIYVATETGYYSVTPDDYCAGTSQQVYITVTGVLSLSANTGYLNVFPNPTGDKLNIIATGFIPQSLSIYDMSGRKLDEQKFMKELDIQFLPAGVYFIEVKNESEVVRSRVIKM